MIIERWTDTRLDRLADAVESNTRNIDILVGIATGQQQRFETVLGEIRDIKAEIRDIKAEIRGLQTENRHILDRLFGLLKEN